MTQVDVDGAPPAVDRRDSVVVGVPVESHDSRGLTYRPALDGLRAVAVLAVLVQHAGLRVPGVAGQAVPGGFLGVDVFFVISGFLITSLLLAEHGSRGRVDLRRFWLRRARRLLPAVALVVAATAVLIAVADLPLDVASARGDALAALAYVANWRFIVTDQSYFDAFGLPSPFRHLWSLSLEEQWYLLFPPLLVALGALRRRPGVLVAGLVAAALASAAWMAALYSPGDDPSRVYYGTDTRAHTLLIGAALAVAATGFPGLVVRLRRWLPWVAGAGLAGLAVAFRSIDGSEPSLYRGGFLAVALASAAVIAGVALPGAAGPAHWGLSRRGAVAVGRISYGLYLWHWPLFVWLTPDRLGIDGPGLFVVRFGLTFLLAGLSYRYVELPIRRHGWAGVRARLSRAGLPAARPALLTAVAGAAVVAIVAVATAGGGTPPVLAARAPTTTLALPRAGGPPTTADVAADRPLPAVPPDRQLRVVVGGDSVAWSLGAGLGLGHNVPPDVRMLTVAKLSCTATPGEAVNSNGVVEKGMCADWHEEWQAAAAQTQADVVVALWGPWEVYDHIDGDRVLHPGTAAAAAAYRQSLRRGVDATIAADPDVRFAFVTVPCMEERLSRLGGAESPRNDPELVNWINRQTEAVAAGYGGRAMVVDLGPLVCPGGEPAREVDGVVTRDDGVHFTQEFAPVVWRFVEDHIRPWLAQPAVSGGG
jgi:peptidoglycan/LPS O-acetylase OafA/YrhL